MLSTPNDHFTLDEAQENSLDYTSTLQPEILSTGFTSNILEMTTAAKDVPDLATLDDDADASRSANQSELGNIPDNQDEFDESAIVFPSTISPATVATVEETTTSQVTEGEQTEETLIATVTTTTNPAENDKTGRNKVEVTTASEPAEIATTALSDILSGNFLDDITTEEAIDDINESTTSDGRDDFINEGGGAAVTEKSSGDVSEVTTESDNDLAPVITTTELANSDAALDTTTAFQNDDDDINDELTTTQPPSVITQKYQIVFSPTTESSDELTTITVANDDITTTIVPTTTEESTCPGSLECGNVCLARDKLCDGLQHCEGGEDELGCDERTCSDGEFRCSSGRCIPEAWKCDGRPDCDSGEDEVACAASCPPGQWLCGEGRCIEAALLCDGTRDCGLGEDEDPGLCNCGEDELRCETGGGCVQAGARCDGRLQCPDRSDEWNCVSLVNNTLEIRSAIKINKRFRKVILKLTELSRVNRTSASPSPRPVCIDQWSDEWSEQACRQLGYSGQRSSSSRYDFTLSDSEFWYRDVSVPVSGNPVQKAAATEGRCRSKETVQLECEEFGKPTLSTLFIL